MCPRLTVWREVPECKSKFGKGSKNKQDLKAHLKEDFGNGVTF